MKIKFIYSENSGKIEDMSKDRVILNLSYKEWRKLRSFISCAEWEIKSDSWLKPKARNLEITFQKATYLEAIWKED